MAHPSRLHGSPMMLRSAAILAMLSGAGLVLAQWAQPAELAASIERFRLHLQHADLDGIMALWTDDAKEISPGEVLGRREIRNSIAKSLHEGVADFREENKELFPGDGIAVETSRGIALDINGDTVAVVRYMTLWKKVDGRWRILREIGIPVRQAKAGSEH